MLGDLFGDTMQKNWMSFGEAFVAWLEALSPLQQVQTSCTSCISLLRRFVSLAICQNTKVRSYNLFFFEDGLVGLTVGLPVHPHHLRLLGEGLSMGLFEGYSQLLPLFAGGSSGMSSGVSSSPCPGLGMP